MQADSLPKPKPNEGPAWAGWSLCSFIAVIIFLHGERMGDRPMTDGFPYADPKTPGNFAADTEQPERDEAKEQRISDLIEKIANLPGITPEDLELLEEITGGQEPR